MSPCQRTHLNVIFAVFHKTQTSTTKCAHNCRVVSYKNVHLNSVDILCLSKSKFIFWAPSFRRKCRCCKYNCCRTFGWNCFEFSLYLFTNKQLETCSWHEIFTCSLIVWISSWYLDQNCQVSCSVQPLNVLSIFSHLIGIYGYVYLIEIYPTEFCCIIRIWRKIHVEKLHALSVADI